MWLEPSQLSKKYKDIVQRLAVKIAWKLLSSLRRRKYSDSLILRPLRLLDRKRWIVLLVALQLKRALNHYKKSRYCKLLRSVKPPRGFKIQKIQNLSALSAHGALSRAGTELSVKWTLASATYCTRFRKMKFLRGKNLRGKGSQLFNVKMTYLKETLSNSRQWTGRKRKISHLRETFKPSSTAQCSRYKIATSEPCFLRTRFFHLTLVSCTKRLSIITWIPQKKD